MRFSDCLTERMPPHGRAVPQVGACRAEWVAPWNEYLEKAHPKLCPARRGHEGPASQSAHRLMQKLYSTAWPDRA